MEIFDRSKCYIKQDNLTQKSISKTLVIFDKIISSWEKIKIFSDIDMLKRLYFVCHISTYYFLKKYILSCETNYIIKNFDSCMKYQYKLIFFSTFFYIANILEVYHEVY
ncbi:XRE family transcriptional regulator [Apilactobacillus timberlakei]|nr:XRE family transcriptional regulator [Apilactobacillus timberlakei]